VSKAFYLTYKEYMKQKYGHALYSVTVDLDLGCPNRDEDGYGGCSFCPSNGARSAQSLDAKSVEEQIQVGIRFAKKRYNAKRFMLYIQAYTGTFTSLKKQKATYEKLLKLYDFDAISIGTRPDCLGKETLEYLRELNKTIDVHIDLGVQTLNDETLKKINREHDSQSSIEAVKKLQHYGIKVFAHIIVGFEGETREDWTKTVKTLVDLKVDGFKIHNLHIIKNTPLHVEYKNKPFKTYDEYEYAEELIHLLRLIPTNIPVLRIATDTPNKDLIAPIWNMQKGQFIEYINTTLQYRYGKSDVDHNLWSKKYKDYYYPKSGAIKQAKELFIASSELEKRLTCKDVKLLDIGFGFGVNSFEALKIKSNHSLHVTALDQDARLVKEIPKEIDFIVGDIRYTLPKLQEMFDVIFLDPFDEEKNTSMVSLEVFKLIKQLLQDDGVLVCSTSLNATRVALSKAGFKSEIVTIDDIKGVVAIHGKQKVEGTFYSDPYLVYSDKQIFTNKS
jgi:radical SAM protein (TIGR01212 family)